MAKPKILIADDERPTRDVMARMLSAKYECLTAADATEAQQIIVATPDLMLLLTDYKMPGKNGVELIREAKSANPALAAILITAFGEIDLAVEAMKEGADDFITKPITNIASLELRIAKALEKAALRRSLEENADDHAPSKTPGSFTGNSETMRRVYALIDKVAPSNASVLIEGPSGSGKELAARALHDASQRANGPFVALECSSLAPSLLETELFGSVKGAYTDSIADRAGCFETADGGTLFLDEIGEIDQNIQVKLLRVLETKSFQRVGESKIRKSDFRLISATNRNLAKLVAEGKFREDLYYRLNVIDLRMPALKDHPEDIRPIATKFLRQFAKQCGCAAKEFDEAAMKALEAYDWPGNVRQLRNAIEKMVVLSSGHTLTLDDVPEEIRAGRPPLPILSARTDMPCAQTLERAPAASTSPEPMPVAASTLADSERAAILSALAECGGNKSKAAAKLGISRRTIHRKLNAWGIK